MLTELAHTSQSYLSGKSIPRSEISLDTTLDNSYSFVRQFRTTSIDNFVQSRSTISSSLDSRGSLVCDLTRTACTSGLDQLRSTISYSFVRQFRTASIDNFVQSRSTISSCLDSRGSLVYDLTRTACTSGLDQPPVTLRCDMAAVYPDDSSQLVEISARLLEVYEHNGSGWVFSSFVSLQLTLWHLDPLRASAFVPLPKWIKDKHAVTNIVGTGDDCFKWAVLAGLHPVADHPHRMESYIDHVNKYAFSSLTFPVPLSAVASFAAKNDISINVYGIEDGRKVIYPLRVSDPVPGKHVDLLLHELGEIQHYSTIKDFSRLISGQRSSHHGAVYCCKKCLHAYSTPELLTEHSKDCCHIQNIKFPKDPRCRFTNIQKQLTAPMLLPATFVQNNLEMTVFVTTVILRVSTVVPLTVYAICSIASTRRHGNYPL